MVVDRLKRSVILRSTLDFDGSVQSTGRSGEGSAVGFNKKKKRARSYYPLFCTVAQTGQVGVPNGTLRFGSQVTNNAGRFIGERDTFFRFGGGLTNAGDVGLSVGLHDILESISNTATGRIMVAGQSTATFYGDVEKNGELFTGQDSQSVFTSDVTGGGNFSGARIVEFAGPLRVRCG